jgi:hypothetical protein
MGTICPLFHHFIHFVEVNRNKLKKKYNNQIGKTPRDEVNVHAFKYNVTCL